MKKILFSLACFFCLWLSSKGQNPEEVRITGNYSDQPLKYVLDDFEQRYKLMFFYQTEWLENITVSNQFSNEPLPSALWKMLKGKGVTFSIYNSYVVLLKGFDEPEGVLPSKETMQLPAGVPFDSAQAPIEQSREFKIIKQAKAPSGKEVKLAGKIIDQATGEAVIGATIFITELKNGTVTNNEGFYSINVPPGKYTVSYSSLSHTEIKKTLELSTNRVVNIDMNERVVQMKEVTIFGEAEDRNIAKTEMSTTKLNIKTIKKMPAFMGEVDVLKSITLLPGVTTVGEGSNGFNVRGGSADQNLVLFDDAPLYNSSHMFGLFSVFNPDVVKDVTLYRGGVPAQFGGRVSSILDIRSKDVNSKKITGRGGIGIVASRLSLEGPLIKDKATFIVAARGSFADPFLKLSRNKSVRETSAYFYDLNAKVDFNLTKKDRVFISGYMGKDGFRFAADSVVRIGDLPSPVQFSWTTSNATVKWGHIFSRKLFSTVTGVYSYFNTEMKNPEGATQYTIPSTIYYKNLKIDFTYLPGEKHKLDIGASAILYDLTPSQLIPGAGSQANPVIIPEEKGLETALYLNEEFVISPAITLAAGLRYSQFHSLGAAQVFSYSPGETKDKLNITDTTFYKKGKTVAQYEGFEPRFSLKVSLSSDASIKVGFTRMRQNIQLISNTTSVIPTDRWKLSDRYILPQIGDQYAIGYFRNFLNNALETSVEVYYKKIQNVLDYKNGAKLLLNEALEADVISGTGRAYGTEFMVRKTRGNLIGWVSYTYSRTFILANGAFREERINEGKYYPANYDKPHFLNVVVTYQRNKRWNLSANYTYSTGRPITYPDGKYVINNIAVANYPVRNNARIPDYHRLDVSATVETNHKKNKKWEGSWTFSIYNLYNRKNAYSVFFRDQNAYKLSVLGSIFPSITYNFKF